MEEQDKTPVQQDKVLIQNEPFEIEELDEKDLENASGGGDFQALQDSNGSGCNGSGCNTC